MKDNDLISRQSLLNSLNRFAPEHFNALVNDLIMKEPAVSFPRSHENEHFADGGKKETQPEPPDVPDTNVGDTISRQAAIDVLNVGAELLRRVLDDADVVGAERAKYEWGLWLIESYISDMKELPSAQPEILAHGEGELSSQPEQRWILCSERLPQPNEEDADGFIKAYLVQDGRWMDVARWNGDCWIAWGYGTALTNVTAWMPLPEPWKEGEADEVD